MGSQEKTQMIKDAVRNLLPHLFSLKENYAQFLEEEREKVQSSIKNLEKLLEIEYKDDTGESELALSILETVYNRDSEIIEEETN